jgi:hypothetical protein
MIRRAQLVLALALLTWPTYAADKIALTCSGTAFSQTNKMGDTPVPPTTIIIDLERRLVTGSLGQFSVNDKTTENEIGFNADSGDGTRWWGHVDRFTGQTTVTAWRNKQVVINYSLMCKRVTPLF